MPTTADLVVGEIAAIVMLGIVAQATVIVLVFVEILRFIAGRLPRN